MYVMGRPSDAVDQHTTAKQSEEEAEDEGRPKSLLLLCPAHVHRFMPMNTPSGHRPIG